MVGKRTRKYVDHICPYCKNAVTDKDVDAIFVDQIRNSRRQWLHRNCFLKEVRKNA